MSVHPLRQFRASNHEMTQDDLAAILGVTAMTVSRWERGRMPRKADWARISLTTGVTPAQLAAFSATAGPKPIRRRTVAA